MANDPDPADMLAAAPRAYLVAAAGCGKTETIAKAAGVRAEGRQLILTHTHAGVKALKDRLRRVEAPRGKVRVDTIAGFALRYALGFPRRSQVPTAEPSRAEEWQAIYASGRRVLEARVGRRILAESFSALYVDEYQDCTTDQHGLILAIADVLPCKIVLDPLQGIFGFGGQTLVSVENDIDPSFDRLPDLSVPWRWRNANPDLGEWLVSIRPDLEAGRSVDLGGAPVEWDARAPQSQRAACLRVAGREGSVVAIGQWAGDCHDIARRLGGAFTSMETIECSDLLNTSARIEEAAGPARAVAVVDFAASCMTRVNQELGAARARLAGGHLANPAGSPERRAAVEGLNEVANSADLGRVVDAMRAIDRLPNHIVFRRELWREMRRTIRSF